MFYLLLSYLHMHWFFLQWKYKERTCKWIISNMQFTSLTFKNCLWLRDSVWYWNIMWNSSAYAAYSFPKIILLHFLLFKILRIMRRWIKQNMSRSGKCRIYILYTAKQKCRYEPNTYGHFNNDSLTLLTIPPHHHLFQIG